MPRLIRASIGAHGSFGHFNILTAALCVPLAVPGAADAAPLQKRECEAVGRRRRLLVVGRAGR